MPQIGEEDREDRISEMKELRLALKSEVREQTAKGVIAFVLGAAVIAATGWWLYLKPKLPELIGSAPAGLVAAFDLPKGCPAGWDSFDELAGRVVIGVGKGDALTERRYREQGGEEAHLLTLEEIPPHSHTFVQMVANNDIDGVDSTTTRSGEHHNEPRETTLAGGGKAHNNMPPFVALRYCKKL